MKLFGRASLRGRMLILIALASAPLLALLWHDAAGRYQRESLALEHDVQRLAEFVSGDVEQLIESTRQLLTAVTVIYRDSPPNVRGKQLLDLSRGSPFVTHFGVASPAGDVLCATASGRDAGKLVGQSLIARAMQSPDIAVGAFRVGHVADRDVLSMAYRAPDERGKDAPVIGFAVLDFSWLEHLLSEERVTGRKSLFPREMVLNILDRSGTILTRYPAGEKWVGKPAVDTPLFRAIMANSDGAAEVAGIDGLKRFYAFSPVKGSSGALFVNVGVSKHGALSSARHDWRRALGAFFIMTLILAAGAWLGADLLVARPIATLRDAARGFGRGKRDMRTNVTRGPREIIELSNAFDGMAEDLLRYERQVQDMTVDMSLAEEQERRQIAQQLHDNVGPLLATCYMKLGRALETANPDRVRATLTEVRQLVDQAVQQTQSLTFELSSPALHTIGLNAALDQLCREIGAEHKLDIEFREDGELDYLPDDRRVIVYQAVRELLRNVVKHAEARHAAVTCASEKDKVSVTVKDDGVGFDASEAGKGFTRSGGFGLFNLRERFAHLGGSFVMESARGRGTLARIALPNDRRQERTEEAS